ncbi:Ig domain-containing protein [Candidatus Poribacteria bacterium]
MSRSLGFRCVEGEIGDENYSPEITSIPVTTARGHTEYSYDVDATDPDVGDILIYSLTTSPSNMIIEPSTGEVTWTPTNEDIGERNVVVEVGDGNGGVGTQSFTIVVSSGDTLTQLTGLYSTDPPDGSDVVANTEITIQFDEEVKGAAVNGIPATGSGKTWAIKVADLGLAIGPATVEITWANKDDSDGGPESISYTVTEAEDVGTNNFAVFGNNGVDISRGGRTIIGNTSHSNVGANSDISIRDHLEIRDGDTHHGGGGDLVFTGNPDQPLLNGEDYGYEEMIPLPCETDFSPYNSEPIVYLDPVAHGEILALAPSSSTTPPTAYGPLHLGNKTVLSLSSGIYYFAQDVSGESIIAGNNVTFDLDVTLGDIWVFAEGRVALGMFSSITLNVVGGGAENIYFETHYHQDYEAARADDPAWSMGMDTMWEGTIFAPFGDIVITDGVIAGQLISGGTVTVHGGSTAIPTPENATYIDFVLSNWIRDNGYACYDQR